MCDEITRDRREIKMKPPSLQQTARWQKMLAVAQQAQQSGLNVQAENLYRDILKEAPNAPEVRHQLAVLLATSGQPQEAIKHFRHILKVHPAHAATHANLANALMEAGELEEAATEYRRAIALENNMVRAHWALGAVLRKLGKSEEAISYYRRALDLDGSSANALNGLGLAYRDIDDLPHALEYLERVVGLEPGNAEFRVNYGETLRQSDLLQPAVEQFYQAATLKPDLLDAVLKLGETLQKQRRFSEARECFERALQLKPGEAEIHERMGNLYLDMGDTARSLAKFRQILQWHPERPIAMLGVARSHLEAGHSKEATIALENLVVAHPDYTDGYFFLALSHKFGSEDIAIPRLRELADQTDENDQAAIGLSFALGKIYDDSQAWDDAFAHYTKGNRMCNREYDYQPVQEEARIDALISVFNRAFSESRADLGVDSRLPVLIVGMPRSGTTLTEQIISSHPQVMGAGEVGFWGHAPTAVPATLGTDTPYPGCMELMTTDMAAKIANEYLGLLHKIAGPDSTHVRITDKMPHNFMHLGLIALLFPHVPIIHCKRDALDNCLSIFFQNFAGAHPYAYDLTNIGHHYRQYQRLMAHWHEMLPGRIFDINYEDTIADPEYWSRKLIAHVGLEWDDACLAPHKLERTVKTASLWQVRQPIYKTSVQRWRNYEKYLGPLKEALEYKD